MEYKALRFISHLTMVLGWVIILIGWVVIPLYIWFMGDLIAQGVPLLGFIPAESAWLLAIGAALLLTVSGLTVIASGQVYLVLLDIRDDLREIYLDK